MIEPDEHAQRLADLAALRREVGRLHGAVQALWHSPPPPALCRQIADELHELAQQLQQLAEAGEPPEPAAPAGLVHVSLDRRRRRDQLRLVFGPQLWHQIGRPQRLDLCAGQGLLRLTPLWTAWSSPLQGYPVEAGRFGQWQIYCAEERAGGLGAGSHPATVQDGVIVLRLPG